METQPSSWLDQRVQDIVDELSGGNPETPMDFATAWTYLRYGYGMGYTEGLQERVIT